MAILIILISLPIIISQSKCHSYIFLKDTNELELAKIIHWLKNGPVESIIPITNHNIKFYDWPDYTYSKSLFKTGV